MTPFAWIILGAILVGLWYGWKKPQERKVWLLLAVFVGFIVFTTYLPDDRDPAAIEKRERF